jgi:exopolyphosphatase/guanosine-5'-triphosphate,3'-diphosphate pyrophosphatase
LKLAAIDIGSNAARLLISETSLNSSGEVEFSKLNLFRMPLRLGFDVFETGRISKEKYEMMAQTLKAFKHLMNAYKVEASIACATSAMREANNSTEVVKKLYMETGIRIEVISGDLEANIIYENHVAEHLDKRCSYLYIDVGGGSTELSFFSDGYLRFKKSFNIGTIRLLKDQVTETHWELFKEATKNATRGFKDVVAIGSGGNINKIFSLSKKKEGKPLALDFLRDYLRELSALHPSERIQLYGLREDRADVIVPALQIYTNVMKWAGAEEIYVPKIGLADGLIHHLWDEIQSGVRN